MDVERLIELVKKHVLLYDLSHKDYKNTGLKAEVWENVARQLHQNDVKLKWKTIKDGYLKYRKQVKRSSGSGKKICNYVWKSQLMFLDKHNVTRKTKSNVLWQEQQGGTSASGSQPDSPTADRDLSPSPTPSPTPPAAAAATSQRTDAQNFAKRKKNSANENDIEEVIGYLNEVKQYDAVDHLFKSYAVTFKKLTCQQQAHIKIEMAKLFANAELNLVYNIQQLTSEATSTPARYQVPATQTTLPIQNQVELPAYSVKREMDED